MKYRCLREVAQTYGHRQCKVNDTPLSDCAGTVHMLTAAPPAAPPQPAETGDAAPATVQGRQLVLGIDMALPGDPLQQQRRLREVLGSYRVLRLFIGVGLERLRPDKRQ